MLVPGKPGFQRARAPSGECMLHSVQTIGATSQLCKRFKAAREGQPLDNTFFLVMKPKHNLATVNKPQKPTWNTRRFFSRAAILFLCSRDFSSA